jgi:hypothetical protein
MDDFPGGRHATSGIEDRDGDHAPRRAAETAIRPPSSVNLPAFGRRSIGICFGRSASAKTAGIGRRRSTIKTWFPPSTRRAREHRTGRDRVREAEDAAPELRAAAFDLRQPKHVVDDVERIRAHIADMAGIFAQFGGRPSLMREVGNQLAEADDRVWRCAARDSFWQGIGISLGWRARIRWRRRGAAPRCAGATSSGRDRPCSPRGGEFRSGPRLWNAKEPPCLCMDTNAWCQSGS